MVVPPPISDDRLVPGLLQPAQHHDLDQIADVKARRGRVEADIAGHDLLFRQRIERFGVGQLVDVAARVEQLEEGGVIGSHALALSVIALARCYCANNAAQSRSRIPQAAPASPAFKVWANVDYVAALGAGGDGQHLVRGRRSRRALRDPRGRAGSRGRIVDRRHVSKPSFGRRAREAYREWNFAPSGEWAAYDFKAYRKGRIDAEFAAPYVRMEDNLIWWALGATIAVPAGTEMGAGPVRGARGEGRRPNPIGRSLIAGDKPDFHAPIASRAASLARAMTLFGIDRLLADPELRKPLEGKRVALLAHPASVTRDLTHSLDALVAAGLNVSAVFGPQHGVRGDLQDNMMESPDFTDPTYGIPVFSLYGEVRRPTGQSMGTFDTILIDLQDLGCRIYTYVTTLLYVLEAAAEHGKSVWVLDRPNPAGRPVEGLTLRPGWESFVGAGPMPMRHGLTLGEMGHWFIDHFKLDVDYRVIEMDGWQPDEGPGFGWPAERVWINPSPNAANLNMARAYAGTVMLEGTTLSEGRGTTRAARAVRRARPRSARDPRRDAAPRARNGSPAARFATSRSSRPSTSMSAKCAAALFIHAEGPFYDHEAFRPWRLQALAFKAIRRLYPDYRLWRDFPTNMCSTSSRST